MCGRFTQYMSWRELVELYELTDQDYIPNLEPRYNLAPSQQVAAVRLDRDRKRKAVMLRWGLIPFWAKDAKIGYRTINARAETVAEKPAFREAFKRRRCLIPANGFYEWQGPKGAKQPYYVFAPEGGLLTFAGLWESWTDKASGERIESCSIIVTKANARLRWIHDRMPVILGAEDFATWLDPKQTEVGWLLGPCPDDWVMAYPVSLEVNKVENDRPELIEEI